MIQVLYVDDENDLLTIGKIFLEKKYDFSVITSPSAQNALLLLTEQSFDAIISDYEMPRMNGLEFLRTIRESGNSIPFIIFTGRGREDVVIEALNSGADFYLQKGGDSSAQFAELADKVRYAVARRNSEKALRESEERYRNVVEVQSEFICRFLSDGTINFVNDAYVRYFGLEKEHIIGKKFRPHIHPEDREMVHRFYTSLSRENPSGWIEQRIIMPDGRVLWQQWNTRAIYDQSGTLKEYQSVGRDITDQKMAEEALQTKNFELAAANEELAAADEELRSQLDELTTARNELSESEERVRKKLNAILSPDGDIGELRLSDIIDVPALQALFDDFYLLTRMSMAIIELDGTVLVATGWQDICTRFHRIHPDSCRNCIESDTILTTGVSPGEFKLYQCKNNLWDTATPVMVGGHHLANLFLGQFLFDDQPPDIGVFRNQAEMYGFDIDEYLAALDRVPRWSREQVMTVLKFYIRIAGIIADLSMNNIRLARTLAEQKRNIP